MVQVFRNNKCIEYAEIMHKNILDAYMESNYRILLHDSDIAAVVTMHKDLLETVLGDSEPGPEGASDRSRSGYIRERSSKTEKRIDVEKLKVGQRLECGDTTHQHKKIEEVQTGQSEVYEAR